MMVQQSVATEQLCESSWQGKSTVKSSSDWAVAQLLCTETGPLTVLDWGSDGTMTANVVSLPDCTTAGLPMPLNVTTALIPPRFCPAIVTVAPGRADVGVTRSIRGSRRLACLKSCGPVSRPNVNGVVMFPRLSIVAPLVQAITR